MASTGKSACEGIAKVIGFIIVAAILVVLFFGMNYGTRSLAISASNHVDPETFWPTCKTII